MLTDGRLWHHLSRPEYTVGTQLRSVGGRANLDCCEPKPKSTREILCNFTTDELSSSGRDV